MIMVPSMETELNALSSNPPEFDGSADPDPVHDEVSTKDDRPLLKSDPTNPVSSDNREDLEKKFAAFVRCDAYGVTGRGELPTREKVLLGLALVTLVPIRVVVVMTMLLFYYLICRICTLFYPPNREDEQEDYVHMAGWRRTVIVQSGRALSRLMLFAVGFYWISETSQFPDTDHKSTTVVLHFNSFASRFVITMLFLHFSLVTCCNRGSNDIGYALCLICPRGPMLP